MSHDNDDKPINPSEKSSINYASEMLLYVQDSRCLVYILGKILMSNCLIVYSNICGFYHSDRQNLLCKLHFMATISATPPECSPPGQNST